MNIGIDLDNTIICYDNCFQKAQNLLGIKTSMKNSKVEVKKEIFKKKNGIEIWKKIQSLSYGSLIDNALIFDGFVEFLNICKMRKVKLFIISHKTKRPHYFKSNIFLRKLALNWINKKINYDENFFEKIFFESTQEDKIKRIKKLNLDYFIDDLEEIFKNKIFPKNIKKILFGVSFDNKKKLNFYYSGSWREITKKIFRSWKKKEIVTVLNNKFKIEGNSNLVKLETGNNNDTYIIKGKKTKTFLKIYKDNHYEKKDRLKKEYKALDFLSKKNFPVPRPILKNEDLNWLHLEFLEGKKPIINKNYLNFCYRILIDLKLLSQKELNEKFSEATEACLSFNSLLSQIDHKFNTLVKIKDSGLNSFLFFKFLPFYENIKTYYKKHCLFLNKNKKIKKNLQILSPSDFGVHNTILNKKKYYILDLEYFGWDDPVKLVSDFYWHPAMKLTKGKKNEWIKSCTKIFSEDKSFITRLQIMLPFFGLRWCLIMLNMFVKTKDNFNKKKLSYQFNKMRDLFKQVEIEYGSKI